MSHADRQNSLLRDAGVFHCDPASNYKFHAIDKHAVRVSTKNIWPNNFIITSWLASEQQFKTCSSGLRKRHRLNYGKK